MKADYLELSNGRKLRICFNMNALCEVTKLTGIEMSNLAGGKIDIPTLRSIAWCSAIQGERNDGKELSLTEIEFGNLLTMEGIVIFSKILTEQSGNSGEKKNPMKGRSPRTFFRRKG